MERRYKLEGFWEHALPEIFQIKSLGNAISCAIFFVIALNEMYGLEKGECAY